MNQSMLIEHGPRQEAFSADQTLIRPLVRMELPDMIIQIRSDGESPIAALESALERLNALMESQMLP